MKGNDAGSNTGAEGTVRKGHCARRLLCRHHCAVSGMQDDGIRQRPMVREESLEICAERERETKLCKDQC